MFLRGCWLRYGLVDPHLLGQAGWDGAAVEPLGVSGVGAVERGLALRTDLDGGAEVDRGGGVHADPGMAVIVIVGVEESVAERAGIGQTAEPLGEVGHVLEF